MDDAFSISITSSATTCARDLHAHPRAVDIDAPAEGTHPVGKVDQIVRGSCAAVVLDLDYESVGRGVDPSDDVGSGRVAASSTASRTTR